MNIVNVRMQVRRNSDGALSDHAYAYESHNPPIYNTYMWLEGNYGCDCNRALFFHRGRGYEPEDKEIETPCGDGGYALVYVDVDGARVIDNDRPGPGAAEE